MQVSPTFEQLRVMVIEDMIYLIHIKGIVEHVLSSLNSEAPLFLVDLEQDPPKVTSYLRLCFFCQLYQQAY